MGSVGIRNRNTITTIVDRKRGANSAPLKFFKNLSPFTNHLPLWYNITILYERG